MSQNTVIKKNTLHCGIQRQQFYPDDQFYDQEIKLTLDKRINNNCNKFKNLIAILVFFPKGDAFCGLYVI